MKNFAKGIWFGFWTAGEFFFRIFGIGALVISDLFGAIARIPDRHE